jgi:hypothetical protein
MALPVFWSPWDHTRWADLVGVAVAAGLGLSLMAGILLVVLKALGRSVRMAHAMRAVALLALVGLVATLLRLVAYYPLLPRAFSWLDDAITVSVLTLVVVTVAGLRKERRSRRFVLAWAGGTLLLCLATAAAWTASRKQQGQPTIDLAVQAPLAGWAGRAQSMEDYLAAVRGASVEAERAAQLNRLRTRSASPVPVAPAQRGPDAPPAR